MQGGTNNLSKFSKHLFWDIDSSELDIKRHARYIISKVIQYGNYSDWKLLVKCYGLNVIISKAQTIRELDKRTATFLSVVGNVPKESFLCYSTRQSSPKHWSF